MIINKSLAKVYSDVAAVNADIGNFSGQTSLQSLLAALGIPDVAGKDLYTCLITDRLDDATVGLSAIKTAAADAAAHADPDPAGTMLTEIGSFSGQTNLQTLLAALGIPDVAAKPLYTCLVTDRLDDATIGLSAIKTAAADAAAHADPDPAGTMLTEIGSFSGQTHLQTLLAALGIPDVAAKPLYTCLITDRLDDATIGLAAIKAAIVGGGSGEDAGTKVLADNADEQTVVELTITDRKLIQGAWLDMVNLTKNGVVRCYYKVDGTNYREFSSEAFTVATDSDGWYIDLNMGVSQDFKITYEADEAEGAARDIPYAIIWQEIQ